MMAKLVVSSCNRAVLMVVGWWGDLSSGVGVAGCEGEVPVRRA